MPKLPTTFQTLDIEGFEITQAQSGAVTREMVDIACSVLQKNRIGIVSRSVQSALKHIYGIGGSTDSICKMLREWRSENMASLKQGREERDIVSALLDMSDDGLIEDEDIPDQFLMAMRQMAIAGYRLAYQNADTTVSGERLRVLSSENETMRGQLREYPMLEMKVKLQSEQLDRQEAVLRDAYLGLDRVKLLESGDMEMKLSLVTEQNTDLRNQLQIAREEASGLRAKAALPDDLSNENLRLQSQMEEREREISSLHSMVDQLNAEVGAARAATSRVAVLEEQLAKANETIARLSSGEEIEVDSPVDQTVNVPDLIESNLQLNELVTSLTARLEAAEALNRTVSEAAPEVANEAVDRAPLEIIEAIEASGDPEADIDTEILVDTPQPDSVAEGEAVQEAEQEARAVPQKTAGRKRASSRKKK